MAGSWDTDLILVALEGDVEPGMTLPLDPERPVHVGRSSKGLQLPDPLVSIHHAEIGFEARRGYFVKDLDSATGTWVDEELIQNDSRPIGIGTRLRFGESVFEVRVRRRFNPLILWAMGGAVALTAVAIVVWLLAGLGPPPPPILSAPNGKKIRQSATYSSDRLNVPPAFARERGIKVSDLRIRKVDDGDYDGLDEVWLAEGSKRVIIITFNSDGSWRQIGELPPDCHPEAEGFGTAAGLAPQNCAGIDYVYDQGEYKISGHDGVVVWTRPRAAGEEVDPETEGEQPAQAVTTELLPEVPLKPVRVVMREPARMAGFLAERGIHEPVHYLICEDAFPGIKAQVLTAMGQIKELSFGCVRHVNLLDYKEGRPAAVAFTANGREALLADVAAFYGGSADPIFADEHRHLIEAAAKSPGYERGALKLTAEGVPIFVDPIPQERPLGAGRILAAKDPRTLPASEPATVATISSEGVAELDPDGCAVLKVTTEDFNCFGMCSGSSTFMTVEEVGCGDPRVIATVPFAGGMAEANVDRLQIRAVVDASSIAGRYRVDHARVAWRTVGR